MARERNLARHNYTDAIRPSSWMHSPTRLCRSLNGHTRQNTHNYHHDRHYQLNIDDRYASPYYIHCRNFSSSSSPSSHFIIAFPSIFLLFFSVTTSMIPTLQHHTTYTHVTTNPSSNLYHLPHHCIHSACLSVSFHLICFALSSSSDWSSGSYIIVSDLFFFFYHFFFSSGLLYGVGQRPPTLLVWRG